MNLQYSVLITSKNAGHNRQGLFYQKGFLTFCLKLLYRSQSLSLSVFFDRRDKVHTVSAYRAKSGDEYKIYLGVLCRQRSLSCMAFSVYGVIRAACLYRSWFVYFHNFPLTHFSCN